MNESETADSADLGSSSSYSHELLVFSYRGPNTSVRDGEALKVVVEKVSLRVALMQGSVGPKCSGKPSKCTFIMKDTKGNQVNIPELRVAGRLSGSSEPGYG